MEDLKQIIRRDAQEVENQFESASVQGRGTPQEIAEFREHALQGFLRNYFPFPYRIAKGGILDHTNKRSDSIDCILINPVHPYTINRYEKFKVILADGVDAAIEVKPDISSISELHRGLTQGLSVKALRRARTPLLLPQRRPQELVEYSLRLPYFIFAMKAKKDIRNTASDVLDFYEREGIPPLDQADAIIVYGRGVIANFPIDGIFPWRTTDMATTGWFFEDWQADALTGLLFKLARIVAAKATMGPPILDSYLRSLQIASLIHLGTPGQG